MTQALDADLGVVISASHNPMPDNGIKFLARGGHKLDDAVEAQIEELLGSPWDAPIGAAVGRVRPYERPIEEYVDHLLKTLDRPLTGLKVVVDCANGAGTEAAPMALRAAGSDVVVIGAEPDGLNINEGCGSTYLAPLQAAVVEHAADAGIALDGDADRVLLVSELGQLIDGDQLMATIANRWAKDGRLVGGGVVATVMSNLGLERYLGERKLNLVRAAVGDRYVLERMRADGYNVGGEQSGHIILSDYCTTGDGLVAALQVLAVVKRHNKPVSEVCHRFEPLPQILKNVRFKAGKPLENANVKTAIASAEPLQSEAGYVELFDRGRRYSFLLFEDVHGDSRDRGPAMVDLAQTYERAGLFFSPGELPDYLPAVLEFASTQPPVQAREFLRETAHIVRTIFSALLERGSPYACVLAAVPLAIAAWKWLVVATTEYELTTQRLRTRRGVLNKHLDELELYRVRDYKLEQPFFLRLFSLSTVILQTSDKSNPVLVLKAIPRGDSLREEMRTYVEEARTRRGVREVDMT
jgi:phosphoglucosamine mutase